MTTLNGNNSCFIILKCSDSCLINLVFSKNLSLKEQDTIPSPKKYLESHYFNSSKKSKNSTLTWSNCPKISICDKYFSNSLNSATNWLTSLSSWQLTRPTYKQNLQAKPSSDAVLLCPVRNTQRTCASNLPTRICFFVTQLRPNLYKYI